MLLVGLTGNIASGKTTVARLLSERGATVIDADVLAHRAVERGTPAFEKIVGRWGSMVLAGDGNLDRTALRRIVFADHDELEELNRIVHPEVARLRDRLVDDARRRGDRIVVCDIPLLFEVQSPDAFDRVILVDAPRPLRLERLVRDRGLQETEAMAMIAAQMPAELKRARSDFVIENGGTMAQLDQRVHEVWTELVGEADSRKNQAAESAPAGFP
jgi:dephospho-CoA kinase